MGLFWTLYGALSAGFLAGAAVYLWRWKQPPEVIVEERVETKIIQAAPEITVVRCRECKHYGRASGQKPWCMCYQRHTMPDAFCSAGERPTTYVAPKTYSYYADVYRNYCRMAEYNTIKKLEEQHE